MSLKNQIQADLSEAMKAKDETKVSALRMLKSAITNWEVKGERKEAKDEDIMPLVKKEIKQRRDSAQQYREGNRPELAEKEEKEIEVLEKYLPQQMSEEEIKKVVQEVIAELGASSKQDFGKVMGAVMGKLKGQADGGIVNKIVGEELK